MSLTWDFSTEKRTNNNNNTNNSTNNNHNHNSNNNNNNSSLQTTEGRNSSWTSSQPRKIASTLTKSPAASRVKLSRRREMQLSSSVNWIRTSNNSWSLKITSLVNLRPLPTLSSARNATKVPRPAPFRLLHLFNNNSKKIFKLRSFHHRHRPQNKKINHNSIINNNNNNNSLINNNNSSINNTCPADCPGRSRMRKRSTRVLSSSILI